MKVILIIIQTKNTQICRKLLLNKHRWLFPCWFLMLSECCWVIASLYSCCRLYVHLPIYCAIGLESGCVGGMGDLLDRLLEGRYASLPLGNTHTVLHKCRNFDIFPVKIFQWRFSKFVETKHATSDVRKIIIRKQK